MSGLERSYAELAPFLFGEREVEAVERSLGPSPSGPDKLDFYRILVARNVNKILSELYPLLRALLEREHPGLWPELVRAYARAHRSDARDPNLFGLQFSAFLAHRRETGDAPGDSAVYEEIADYQMCRYLAASAPESPPSSDARDGFEQRVFIRGYTHPIPSFVAALRRSGDAPLPEPRPITLIVYRSLIPPARPALSGLATHVPTLAEVAALAERQGLTLAGPLASVEPEARARGLARLVERGVLNPA